MKGGQPAKAIASFEEALRLRPAFPEAHNNLGLALERLERNREAAAHYSEALKLNPLHAEAHYNLGNLFYKTDRYELAATHFTQALHLRPGWARRAQWPRRSSLHARKGGRGHRRIPRGAAPSARRQGSGEEPRGRPPHSELRAQTVRKSGELLVALSAQERSGVSKTRRCNLNVTGKVLN